MYIVILNSFAGACSIQVFFFTSHLIILCKLVLSSCFKPSALSPQPPPLRLLCPNMRQEPLVGTAHRASATMILKQPLLASLKI